MVKSDLPFGSEFSPSQIDLPQVLDLAKRYGGDWKAFESAIRAAYFEGYRTNDYNRGKLANNCKLGMIAYGIIDRDARLTAFGEMLWSSRGDSARLYRLLAHRILLALHGITLIQTVQDMDSRGERITLNNLREWLEERNVHFPRGGKHASVMRLWLEKASVFARGTWRVNSTELEAIVGTAADEIEALGLLSQEQRAYLKALANLGGPGPYLSNEVEKLASLTYGVKFNEKNLPKSVLYPLVKAGYVSLTRGTKAPGRGAKPFQVMLTEKFSATLIEPLLESLEKQTRAELRPLLRKSLSEILEQVTADDKHRRGLALEALGFYLMRLIDLRYVATRLRGTATGGAEVDILFEGTRLLFSRWQIQCKNTARVALDDVAKEVGLTHMLKSNVIVMVSTGRIGEEARKYSRRVMKDSNLNIVLIDETDLKTISEQPPLFSDVLTREAERAMAIKKLDLE